jgi:hypothetical protein
MEKTELQKALQVLTKALKEDDGYRMTWVANIAVEFQDTYNEHHRYRGVHEISNMAAENFIELLTSQVKD